MTNDTTLSILYYISTIQKPNEKMNSYEYYVKWLTKLAIMTVALVMAEKFHPESWKGLEKLLILAMVYLSAWLWDSQGVKFWKVL